MAILRGVREGGSLTSRKSMFSLQRRVYSHGKNGSLEDFPMGFQGQKFWKRACGGERGFARGNKMLSKKRSYRMLLDKYIDELSSGKIDASKSCTTTPAKILVCGLK